MSSTDSTQQTVADLIKAGKWFRVWGTVNGGERFYLAEGPVGYCEQFAREWAASPFAGQCRVASVEQYEA